MRIRAISLVALFLTHYTHAKPGEIYTLTGKEKGISEIILADMTQYPECYKGETLNSYIAKFKRENSIGKRKLSPGDQLRFPETLASIKINKRKAEEKTKERLKKEENPQRSRGSIRDVATNKANHMTAKRGTYKAQTFEYSYSVGPSKLVQTKSFFEFKDKSGKIIFMSSGSYRPNSSGRETGGRSILYIPAEDHGLINVKLKAYWIQIYATDEFGEKILVAEKHEGCSSLEELKKRNKKPISV